MGVGGLGVAVGRGGGGGVGAVGVSVMSNAERASDTEEAGIRWIVTGSMLCCICGGTGWDYQPEGKICVSCWGRGRVQIVEPVSDASIDQDQRQVGENAQP